MKISISVRGIGFITDLAGYDILCRSCLNELMRSNNFDVKVPLIMCTEVKAQANNCEAKASLCNSQISKIPSHMVDGHEKTDF